MRFSRFRSCSFGTDALFFYHSFLTVLYDIRPILAQFIIIIFFIVETLNYGNITSRIDLIRCLFICFLFVGHLMQGPSEKKMHKF